MIIKLKEELEAVKSTSSGTTGRAPTYDGTPGTLQGFLTQTRLHLRANHKKYTTMAEWVMFAAGQLKGNALAWFEPTLRDYVEATDASARQPQDGSQSPMATRQTRTPSHAGPISQSDVAFSSFPDFRAAPMGAAPAQSFPAAAAGLPPGMPPMFGGAQR